MNNSNAVLFAKNKKQKALLALINEASRQDIIVTIISPEEFIIKFSKNETFILSQKYKLPFNRKNAFIAINKNATKIFLNEYDIRTPQGIKATSFPTAIEEIKKRKLSYPFAVKPVDGSLARGISLNIENQQSLKIAIVTCQNSAPKQDKSFLIEEMIFGDEYRILVLNYKVIAVAKKIPTKITGDGKSTVTQLIERYNETRLPNYTIIVNEEIKERLSKLAISLDTIIPCDKEIQLLDTVLMRAGGRCVDYTKECPEELKDVSVRSAEALGLTYVGIDVIAKINTENSSHHNLEDYAILEVNNNPVHIINEAPLCEDATVNVSQKLLQYFFENKLQK